jgi:hypothetical protein
MNRIADATPRTVARITGVFYLLTIVAGIIAQGFISGRLIVEGDAATTAANILAHKSMFEWGFTIYLFEMACQVASTALFYQLLKPVSRPVALLSAFWELGGCVIKTMARLFYIAPLYVLGGAQYMSVFNTQQSQALALLMLKLNDRGAGVALAFFGFSTILHGYLVYKSTFLPRILGVLSLVAGVGWLTFLYPPLGYRAFPFVAAIGFMGAVAMILWLIIVGVKDERWKEQAVMAATSIWR